MAKALRVDPVELRVTAESLSSHAESFLTTHEMAHSRAGGVALGMSKAAAALPVMLAEWQTSGTHFAAHHVKHAQAVTDLVAAIDSDDGSARRSGWLEHDRAIVFASLLAGPATQPEAA